MAVKPVGIDKIRGNRNGESRVKECNGLITTVTPACLSRRNQIKSLNSTQLEFSFGVGRYFVFPLPQANRTQSKN